MAADRHSDGVAPFARLCHFAGLIGSHETTVSCEVFRQSRRQPSLHTLARREVAPHAVTSAPLLAVPPQTASVQLSENANADVEKGRPSRSRGQDCPLASMPLRTRRVPSAGINTVHTP